MSPDVEMFELDEEIAAGMVRFAATGAAPERLVVGDVEGRRKQIEQFQPLLHDGLPAPSGVSSTDFELRAADAAPLTMRWYVADGSTPGSAVVYLPGGGMIFSDVALYDRPVGGYVAATGVPFLSVGYRHAPEHRAPAPVLDAYAALEWLVEHAALLGVDPARIAVMGDSAGGGVAASLAIYARDRGGPAVARQLLVYAMLDDRNTRPDEHLVVFAGWDYDDNATGWNALLCDRAGEQDVSPYAAAARLIDPVGLPPAYIEVGELDIFRQENIEYATRLLRAGVSTELHVHPGAPHVFDSVAPESEVARRARADRCRVISRL